MIFRSKKGNTRNKSISYFINWKSVFRKALFKINKIADELFLHKKLKEPNRI